MSVYLDGATLSALFFNYLNSSGSQYGFLIGEKIEHIEDRISDSQILTYDVNSYIYVSSFVPWPSGQNIYSRGGHFDEEWLKHFFANTDNNLIGWYSFRHNTSPRPSLREISLHNKLSTSNEFTGHASDFLFFLCTSSFSSNMSTHNCTHGFMRTKDGCFVPVPMTVMNLGDTTRKDYKKRSNVALSHSRTVQESLHTFKKGFLKSSGELEQITKMNHLATSINKSLMSVHNKVFESEATLGLLETDVSMLKQRIEQIEKEELNIVKKEAENKQTEMAETMIKQFSIERTEEIEQLEKLLDDLGISSNDNLVGATNFVPNQHLTASFPLDRCLNDDDIGSFQIVDLTPSILVDDHHEHSNIRNKNSTVETVVSDTQIKYTPCEAKSTATVNVNVSEMKRPQSVKDKVSEAFSFLDEELKLNKQTATQKQQATHLQIDKNTNSSLMHNKISGKGVTVNNHNISHNTRKLNEACTERSIAKNRVLVDKINNQCSAGSDVIMLEKRNGIPH